MDSTRSNLTCNNCVQTHKRSPSRCLFWRPLYTVPAPDTSQCSWTENHKWKNNQSYNKTHSSIAIMTKNEDIICRKYAIIAAAYPRVCSSMSKVIVDLIFHTGDAVTGCRSSARQTARTAALASTRITRTHAVMCIDVVVRRTFGNTACVLFKVNARQAEWKSLTNTRPTLRVASETSLSPTTFLITFN